MGQRKLKANRCPRCGLHEELCLCASRPRLDLRTHLLFVQHSRERHKPTNTARLALQIFTGAQMVWYGARDEAMDVAPLEQPDRDYLLLFQRDDAITLTPEVAAELSADGRQPTLVVPDGTWHQCSRMARRAPRIAELQCYTLPEGPPSQWGIRTPPRPGALSTFEATCRAMALLEGDPAATRPAEAWFAAVTRRLWQMRGYARPEE
ncbi:MAG: tRNA-uridine aminocarboxypropyltransferase [Nannocystaceae bacterium]